MRLARVFLGASLLAILVIFAGVAGAQNSGLATGAYQANFAGWLKEAVKAYLTAELYQPGVEVKSIEVMVPSLFKPPQSYDSFDISIPKSRRKGSKVFLMVTLSDGGKQVSRLNVIADVKVEKEIVVAKRAITRGSIMGEDQLKVRKMLADPFSANLITDLSEAIGKQAERNIRKGFPIYQDHLSWPKMVRVGDVVTIVAASGSMRITTLGKARQGGDKGDWIMVSNLESKKSITAQITGPGQVRVEF